MNTEIIKIIVYMITMSIVYAIINNMNSRNQIAVDTVRNQDVYVVKAPSALKGVCFAMFGVGFVLFCFFLVLKLKNNPTVTQGHLVFAAVFTTIGLIGMVLAT